MSIESTNDVPGVASHALFGRLLFVYAINGVVKCFSAEEIRPLEAAMLDIGWKHAATIDPARWIEVMANGTNEPSYMLVEAAPLIKIFGLKPRPLGRLRAGQEILDGLAR